MSSAVFVSGQWSSRGGPSAQEGRQDGHRHGRKAAWQVRRWGAQWRASDEHDAPEAGTLSLDSSKIARVGWRPVLDVPEATAWTVEWHCAHLDGRDVKEAAESQIGRYCLP